MRLLLSLSALGLAGVACAITDVVPNGFAGTPANGTFLISTTAAAGRTYQYQLAASQLTNFVGTNLNGMQMRLQETLTADYAGCTFSQFDIFIGKGVAVSSRSSTFASNFIGTPTQVRSGALTLGSFSSVGSPVKPFGPVISFSNYLYSGGDLTIELRYSGSSINGPTLDAATSTTTGYGTLFAASWGSASNATTATGSATANVFVTQLTATAVPEPASMAALGLGVVALLRRRKK